MTGAPVFTQILVSPEDLPFWSYNGENGSEFLTLLDTVGDLTFPNVPTTHIAPALTGSWGLYQLLTGHTPHADTAAPVAEVARAVGLDLLAGHIDAALPDILAEPDMERAGDLLFTAASIRPWSEADEPYDEICDRFARWIEANLPRREVESRSAFQDEFRRLWAETEHAHPHVLTARQSEVEARKRMAALLAARRAKTSNGTSPG